ncbi:hypothetical protein V8E54_014527 [Elaphomyces granulatus]
MHVPKAWGTLCGRISIRLQKIIMFETWIRIMPTNTHDAHQIWVNDERFRYQATGTITLNENLFLTCLTGTTTEFLGGPYSGFQKEPDLMIRPDNQQLPSFAIEFGWVHGVAEQFTRRYKIVT